jgi:hypothetical protein
MMQWCADGAIHGRVVTARGSERPSRTGS